MLPALVSAADCAAIAAPYPDDRHFRSHVLMPQHRFGRGEYEYFAYPLPDPLPTRRTALYPRLVAIANRWHAAIGLDVHYPPWRAREARIARNSATASAGCGPDGATPCA